MKFRCERDTLAEALVAASRAVSARASLPVLSGLLLDLHDGELRVTASDLDTTISVGMPVEASQDGVAVVNARLMTDIVRALDPGAVEIAVADHEAAITSGRSAFSVHITPATEFPNLVEPSGPVVSMDAASLARAVDQVIPAASTDQDRPILRGVKMEPEGDGIRLVATDSYRLAVCDLPGVTMLPPDREILVPRTALAELVKALDDAETVAIQIGERDISFEVGNVRITTRLIEGQFPNYRSLIPQAHPNKLTVSRLGLIDVVRRVKVVARDAATPVRMVMKPEGLELSVTTQDYGTSFEQLDAKFEGTELSVAFNPEYLIQGAEKATGDEVTIDTVDNLKPALLHCPDNDHYRYVLMPVRFP